MNNAKEAVTNLITVMKNKKNVTAINTDGNIDKILFTSSEMSNLGFRNAFELIKHFSAKAINKDVFLLQSTVDITIVFVLDEEQYWLCTVDSRGGLNAKAAVVKQNNAVEQIVYHKEEEFYKDPYYAIFHDRYRLDVLTPTTNIKTATEVAEELRQKLEAMFPDNFDGGVLKEISITRLLSEWSWLYDRAINLRLATAGNKHIPVQQILIDDNVFIFHYKTDQTIPFIYWNPNNHGIVQGGVIQRHANIANTFKVGMGDGLLALDFVKEMFELTNDEHSAPSPEKKEMKISDFEITVKEFTTYLCDYLEEKGADFILNTTTDLERLLVEVTVSQMVNSMSERLVKNIFALSDIVHAKELTPTQFNALREIRHMFQTKDDCIHGLNWLEPHYKWLKKELYK